MKKRGTLIVFEGTDGVGKATQTALLAKRLKKQGMRVTVFSSPRYDLPTGKLVRRALSGEFGDFVAISPYFSALPYFVDFSAWRDQITDALKGGIVICDRHVHSTIAYASGKLSGAAQKTFLAEVERIAFKELKLPLPTRVVLLDVPVDVSRTLMAKRKQDQFEKNYEYQKSVAKVYKQLARAKNWRTVQCTEEGRLLSRGEIAERVWAAIR